MAKAGKKRHSSLRFLLGMLFYALLVVLLIAVGMRLFWDYIDEYEQTRPQNAMAAYMQSLDEEHIRALSADFIAGLDPEIQSLEESQQAVFQTMRDLRYARKGSESGQYRTVYIVSNPERELGRVVLTKPEDPRFGFSHWSVEEESYDFSWLLGSDEITVPDNWTVTVGGNTLGSEYVVQTQIPYAYLRDFYGKEGLYVPSMCTYRIENYVGSAPFTVYNNRGEMVTRDESWGEDLFLDNCTEEQKAAVTAYVGDFLPRYIQCLSNSNHSAYENYTAIQPYVLSGSDLDRRLYEAISGLQYAHSKGDTIESVRYERIIELGGGQFLTELTYELDMVGYDGHVKTTNHAQLLMQQTEAGLKAFAIYSY